METGLIIAADEFFGLALCEYMMKEGIQVDITCPNDHTKEQKMLLEERMMWLGRNDLFRVIDLQNGKDTYDLIFIQSQEPDQRQEDIKARQGIYRILYEQPGDESTKQDVPAVILPRMFGPWTLKKERAMQDDEAFFVEDVAKDLFKWAAGTNRIEEKTHKLKVKRQTDDQQAEEMIAEWKRQNSTFFDKKQE